MARYSITVVRGGGERHSIPVVDHDIRAVFDQALERAQNLVVRGCPFGDAIPPQCIEIHDEHGGLVISIAIDESLRPIS